MTSYFPPMRVAISLRKSSGRWTTSWNVLGASSLSWVPAKTESFAEVSECARQDQQRMTGGLRRCRVDPTSGVRSAPDAARGFHFFSRVPRTMNSDAPELPVRPRSCYRKGSPHRSRLTAASPCRGDRVSGVSSHAPCALVRISIKHIALSLGPSRTANIQKPLHLRRFEIESCLLSKIL